MADDETWREYERVARFLLDSIASELGFDRVEGKQPLQGRLSGTTWEADAKGVLIDGKGFVVIECRRTSSRQTQADMGSLAYVIQDTGAKGGLIVCPLPLQEGAELVAKANRIIHVQIDANSTERDFALRFLNRVLVGASSNLTFGDSASDTVTRKCASCAQDFLAKGKETKCPACSPTGPMSTQTPASR